MVSSKLSVTFRELEDSEIAGNSKHLRFWECSVCLERWSFDVLNIYNKDEKLSSHKPVCSVAKLAREIMASKEDNLVMGFSKQTCEKINFAKPFNREDLTKTEEQIAQSLGVPEKFYDPIGSFKKFMDFFPDDGVRPANVGAEDAGSQINSGSSRPEGD